MANLHIIMINQTCIIHLTLEFKYESRKGLTMLMKTQKYDKALMQSNRPKMQALIEKPLSQNDQNSFFMMQI